MSCDAPLSPFFTPSVNTSGCCGSRIQARARGGTSSWQSDLGGDSYLLGLPSLIRGVSGLNW